MIRHYITHIQKMPEGDTLYPSGYLITGDGEGDFSNRSDATTTECLEDYVEECEEQLRLALQMLDDYRRKKRGDT